LNAIREAREQRNMSMDELARAAGVTKASICRYEKGKRMPRISIVYKMAKALGVPWYTLIDTQKAG